MSWAKMAYTQLLLLLFGSGFVQMLMMSGYMEHDIKDDIVYIVYLIFVPLCVVSFAISLHVGKIFGVLDLDNTEGTNIDKSIDIVLQNDNTTQLT
jgi:hypothetical protein